MLKLYWQRLIISRRGKGMKVDKLKSVSGQTAIFWLDMETCKVYGVKSPLSQSEPYNGFLTHKSCHYDSWSAIQALNPKWQSKGLMYEDFARGRCVFHIRQKYFYVYVCPLVKGNRKAQKAIIQEFQLPRGKYCFHYDDDHYFLQSY